MNSKEIANSGIRGSVYFLILAWFSTGINFVLNIVLARILFPEDFGLSAISFTIIGIFSMFIGFGLGPGVIQSKEEKTKLFSTYFFIELITITLFSLLIYCFSGIFANLFGDARIEVVVKILVIYVVLSGLDAVPRTYLTKELEFRKLTLIESFGIILNLCISLILALNGFGYWSLIYGPIIAIIFRTACFWILAPIIPRISCFDSKVFKDLLKFAVPILLASVVIFWSVNIDDMMVAGVLGLTFLGYYSLAFKLSNYVSLLISAPISKAMYPVYCKMQDNKTEFQATFDQNYRMIFTITIFISVFVSINAYYIMSFLFGDKWLNSIPILQILMFEGFLQSLSSIAGNVFLALKKYYWVLITSGVYFCLMTPIMIAATIYFGVIGTALSVVLTNIPVFFLTFLVLRKFIQYNIMKDSIIRIVGVGITIPPMILIIYLFNGLPLLVLGLNLVIALVIYAIVVNYLTKGNFWREIREIFDIILKRNSGSAQRAPEPDSSFV